MVLYLSWPAVSQIWSLIRTPSIVMILQTQLMPMVIMQLSTNLPSLYLRRMLLLPTPESPIMMIFWRQSKGYSSLVLCLPTPFINQPNIKYVIKNTPTLHHPPHSYFQINPWHWEVWGELGSRGCRRQCLINIINKYINLSMSIWAQECAHRRRTSERRRLKMLRNLDQYKISNPYRYSRKDHPIPDELTRQLKKIDYLSSTSIGMLSLPFLASDPTHNELVLAKMAIAWEDQEKRYDGLFGSLRLDCKQLDLEEYSHSEHHQANPSQGSDAVQTKDDDMPIPLYSYEFPRDNLEESIFQAESKAFELNEIRSVSDKQSHRIEEVEGILGQDYEKYFIS